MPVNSNPLSLGLDNFVQKDRAAFILSIDLNGEIT